MQTVDKKLSEQELSLSADSGWCEGVPFSRWMKGTDLITTELQNILNVQETLQSCNSG